MEKVRILFFIAGMVPTEDEIKESNKLGFCAYRNSSNYKNATSTEQCDFVAGLVPEIYSDFPTKGAVNETQENASGNEKGNGHQEIRQAFPETKVQEKVKAWTPNS